MKKMIALLLSLVMMVGVMAVPVSFAEELPEDPEAAFAVLQQRAEALQLPDDLEQAKEIIAAAQSIAEQRRSALKGEGKGIDEAGFNLFKLGAELSLQIVDQLTEEEKTANNNSYGLCANYTADCYSAGTGTEKDMEQAEKWYYQAVYTFKCSRSALSYADALYKQGRYQEAYEAYEYAWKTFNHMKALRKLGEYYENGLGGLYEKDCVKAETFYKLGAEAGDGTSFAKWANLYVRQKMGKGKPAVFRYTAYEILKDGVSSLLKVENIEDQAAVSEAVAGIKSIASVDDTLFLMGYVMEMGYESQDGAVKADPDLDAAAFWYGLLKGKSHEFGYDFDAASARVAEKLSGAWVEWDKNDGGVDKMLDEELVNEREGLTARFETGLEYSYEGGSFKYNVYLPDSYSTSEKAYPVVLFLHDGSISEKSNVTAPMMQGWGATIWIKAEGDNEVIVIAPVGYNTDKLIDFMDAMKETYRIDDKRVYLTGQSAGCIAAYALNAAYPDYFTATMYVSGQASGDIPTYEEISEEYASQKWIFICSAGDTQAYPGIQVIMKKLDDQGAAYETTQFSAALDLEAQNAAVDELLNRGCDRNIVIFDEGTVTWYNLPMVFADQKPTNPEHMYAFDAAYRLDAARSWLLSQVKE